MPARKKSSKAQREADRKFLTRIRERFRVMTEADQENRRDAMEDFKFVNVPGYQWDDNMRKERGSRPCYEFNKLRVNGKRVINEIRANRPQGKVRPTEGGDKKIAELYEGLIRNIWARSDGDSVVDYASEYIVDAGMGVWRIDTEYSDDDTFDQDIVARAVKNPFCVYVDPACRDPMKRDAEDWLVTERIPKSVFRDKYPDAREVDFEDSEFDDDDEWEDEETVRIAEYWFKEPYDKEIWLVQFEGEQITVDSTTDEAEALQSQYGDALEEMIVRRRMVKTHRIKSGVVSGAAVLEPPEVRAGREHRFVMVYGEFKVIDGKVVWHGLHRFSKDAQQSYNVSRTAIDETIATAPKQGFWATPTQAEGLTDQWSEAHKKNLPFRLYNADPQAPGPPGSYRGADVPVALLSQAEMASQDIRDTSGLHEASFGEESNEKSGIALQRKQSQASIVTYNFPDNIAKGIQRTWEILIDLIPEIYDAEREIRVLGEDGAEDYATINQVVMSADGTPIRVNDMSMGKYDVTITVGPSYSTMRQEAAEVYGEIGAKNPALMEVAGDLVFKSLDYPFAEAIAERWKTILPPPIQKLLAEGKDIPPEAQQAMMQAEQAMQQVQQQAQLVQQAGQEAEQMKAENEKGKAEIQGLIAKLDAEQAKFEAQVSKQLAQIEIKQAQLTAQSAEFDSRQVQGDLDFRALQGAQEAVKAIDEMAATFMERSSEILQEIEARSSMVIAMPRRGRVKGVRARRVNGELVAEPEYDGESDEPRIVRIRSQRGEDGSLVGVPEYEDGNGL